MIIALRYNLKSRKLIPLVPFFFLNIALTIWGLLYFHTNYEVFHFSSVENAIGNSIGIALNPCIALGRIVIFTILIHPIQKRGISLHLFVLSLVYFISVL